MGVAIAFLHVHPCWKRLLTLGKKMSTLLGTRHIRNDLFDMKSRIMSRGSKFKFNVSFQIEVLHVSKEEREAALMQPLCELILDWSQKQWLDDGNLTLDNFTSKVNFLASNRRQYYQTSFFLVFFC